MWRLYHALTAHRAMLRAIFLGIAVAAMVLSVSGIAAADGGDGFDP